jgi:hypothetical protein
MFPAYTTYMAVRKLPLTTTFLGFLKKFPNQETYNTKIYRYVFIRFLIETRGNTYRAVETLPCLANKKRS